MKQVCLIGRPRAGKSLLTAELSNTHMPLIFSDILKNIALEMLTPFARVSMADLKARKEHYRPFLQSLGTVVGFNTNPKYIEESLYLWKLNNPRPACTFDNARTVEQVRYLRETYGFQVVRLSLSHDTFKKRGGRDDLWGHPLEQGLPEITADLDLDASMDVKVLAQAVRDA